MKVRVGSKYKYEANGMDIYHPVPDNTLQKGDIVEVINLPNAPRANTMGQCYVAKDGKFVCMVSCKSLTPHKEKKRGRSVLQKDRKHGKRHAGAH